MRGDMVAIHWPDCNRCEFLTFTQARTILHELIPDGYSVNRAIREIKDDQTIECKHGYKMELMPAYLLD